MAKVGASHFHYPSFGSMCSPHGAGVYSTWKSLVCAPMIVANYQAGCIPRKPLKVGGEIKSLSSALLGRGWGMWACDLSAWVSSFSLLAPLPNHKRLVWLLVVWNHQPLCPPLSSLSYIVLVPHYLSLREFVLDSPADHHYWCGWVSTGTLSCDCSRFSGPQIRLVPNSWTLSRWLLGTAFWEFAEM